MSLERGYRVKVVKTPAQALASANDAGVHAIILGPEVEHYPAVAVAESLRKEGLRGAIVRVERSVNLTREIEVLHAGADDVVPAAPHSRLIARFEASLRRGSGAYACVAEIGPLLIHRHLRTAEVSGGTVPLTPAEFDVLAYLALRSDRIVPAKELSAAVLHGGAPGRAKEKSRIKRHVSRIRSKLGRARNLLWTVRGRGYRLAGGDEASSKGRS
jgi:DNA-binding response OmpR family regulator